MPDEPEPLNPERVRRRCDPRSLGFETTAELEPLDRMVGQERAAEAIRFAMSTRRTGYNVFVLGPPGMGKHGLVRRLVESRAKGAPVPDDWIYVFRFDDADRPQAMRVPAGRGAELARAMENLTDELGDAIRAAFETDEFRNRRRVIEQRVEGQHEEAFSVLAEAAEKEGLKLLRTPGGLAFAPLVEGKVIGPDEFAELPSEQQGKLREKLSSMEDRLQEIMREVPRWQRAARDDMRALEQEMASYAAAHQLEEVRAAFADLEEVSAWLERVERDVVEHAAAFIQDSDGDPEAILEKALARGLASPLSRYRVNVFVDRTGLEGAPVVYEDHPTLTRLVGEIEQRAHLGALVSDFTLIKRGALHEANGGTLILDARQVLSTPAAYESLERALRRGHVEIESIGRALGLRTGSLDPDPIPLDVKVVLIGDRRLYYRLRAVDPHFDHLFKVMADFEDDVPWDEANQASYARLFATIGRDEGLLPLAAEAVARLLEHASRQVEDSRRLSSELVEIADTLREAHYRATEREAERIEADDVCGAIDARRRREGRIGERLLDRFRDGTVRVATSGEVVGQINGLSVMGVGRTRIGQPNRITARVRLGRGEVIDIEREAELGGPLHSKGVLILGGYLGATYTPEAMLTVKASLVFEQSYGGVDGDSASLAELCCLLSAIGEVPIQQRFAVTGSVDQRGQVQAIGGVNDKIEGYFDVCACGELDGSHAVLIPKTNVPHLMLRDDVVAAIEAGRFAVYAVDTVDDALALLTGIPAGAAEDGEFPEATVHGRVQRRLARLGERARDLLGRPEDRR